MSDLHALTGAYAVDALDDLERARFERHLADCADCQAEVQSLREATALLAEHTAVAPPPALRDRVLAEIATVRPLPPVVPPTAAEDATARRRLSWLPLLVAASVFAVLGVGLALWQPWSSAPPTLSAAERVLQAADAQSVSLTFDDGSQATLVRSVSEGRAVIKTSKMAPAPAGKVYELWLQHPDGRLTPAGLMPAKADQTVLLEGDASQVIGAGISVEPAGGSPQPTSDPIALFDLQA
jgi:anti-sigma-K factor RskA